jgi:hypothetical protein
MQESRRTSCREGPFALIPDYARGVVDSDNPNTDRIATATPELIYLIAEIVDHAIYLLNHGLRQDLYLNPDFDSGYRAAGHQITGVSNGALPRNNFAERSVATPGGYATALVLNV